MNAGIGILAVLLVYSIVKVVKEVRSIFFSLEFELSVHNLYLITKGIVIGMHFMIALNVTTYFIVSLVI